MQFAMVTGHVVCTRKDPNMPDAKLALIQPLTWDMKPRGSELVATDVVGAGEGEVVLFAKGSSARQTVITENKPVDGIVIAVVDQIEKDGKIVFRKGKDEPDLKGAA